MERKFQKALERWVQLTSDKSTCNFRQQTDDLTSMPTGNTVDIAAKLAMNTPISVSLSTSGRSLPGSQQRVTKCLSYLVDVPSDGDCGFTALCTASFPYGGTTFMGTGMPSSAHQGRLLLAQFLKCHRSAIEDAVINCFGEGTARAFLWSDVRGYCSEASGWSFTQLSKSIINGGLSGHWLGAGIGEAEMHLLGRMLGVSVHCVTAAEEKRERYILRQTICPSSSLWSDQLQGTPKGAVVIRFVGSADAGHYQIVKCFGSNSYVPVVADLVGSTVKRNRKKRKRNEIVDEEDLERDMAAIFFMHGAQPPTKDRYQNDYDRINHAFKALMLKNIDPMDLETNGARVVKEIMRLLLQRCGPREKGYQNLSAKSTGKVILAAVASWFKDHGKSFTDNHTCVVTGNSVYGPPWRAKEVTDFKENLQKMQAKTRAFLEKKAYQLTHDDIAAAMRAFVATQLGLVLDTRFASGCNQEVNWLAFQVALMVVAAFGPGCRGAELTAIRLGDLRFLNQGPDTTIGATLYGVKSKTGEKAIRRIVFPSWSDTSVINPAFAVLLQIAAVHGVSHSQGGNNGTAPLFPNIHRNQVLRGQLMASNTYSAALKAIFKTLGITDNATEHSPRRGGSGFRYYVLGEHPDYIRDILGHANTTEALNYIGFEDAQNSYVIQGYGTCGTKKIR